MQENQPTDDQVQLDYLYDQVSAYFSLLSEPMRLRILHELCDKELSVNDVLKQVGTTQANVSRHLTALYKARVLARRKEGTTVYYAVADQNAVQLCRTVSVNLIAQMSDIPLTRRAAGEFMKEAK